MLVHDSDGNVWIGSASKMEYYETSSAYNQAGNYVTNSDKSSGYVESEWNTPILALSKCSWEEASADNRHTQWILQGKGSGVGQNGYRTSDQYAYYTVSNTGDVYYTYNSATFATLTGKNITEIKNYGAYVLLFGADGTVWVTVANTGNVNSTSFYRMTAKSLFSGADVAKVWTETTSNSFISGNDSNGTPHYGVTTTQTLVVLDSKGRYWKAVYNVIQAEGWNGSSYTGTTETSYRWEVAQMTSVDKEKYPSGNDIVPIRTEYVEYLWKCMFERPGYTFKHWTPNADGTGISYLPSERYVITEATTIYAQWVPAKNILRYRPNGGVGIIPEETYELTVTKALIKENVYTRKGYEFTGWNTQADGKGTSYQSGQYIPLVQEGITYLYAQWKKVSSYTIQVSKNDISVRPVVLDTSKTKTLTADQIYTMPDGSDISFQVTYDLQGKGVKTGSSTPTVTLTSANTDGYLTFSGWLLFEKNGTEYDFTGKRYNAGAQASNLGTKDKSVMTLFPYYSGDAATVLLPLPTCVGYNFIGWGKTTTETDPGKLYHIEEDVEPIYQPSGNETLYAYWEAKTYGLSLIATHPQASEGEIIQTQSSVLMTYDKELPTVRIPQSERFVFLGYYDKLDSDGIPTVDAVQYYDMNGMAVTDEGTGKPQTWTIDDGSVTTLYAYLVSEVEITLDGRGATKQEQTRVTMTYDEFGPNVIPPEKTGYVFGGYYTGLRGSGKKYYDTLGESVSVWRENGTDVLYAYWIQNPVEIPEKDDTEAPESMPTDRMEVKVALDEATVQVYADDGNPVTGADTDLPPYQVEDIVRDGILESAGGIPSTEQVAVRAKMGSWLLSCVLERKSGVDNVRILVTVPYRTQYEDTEDESLIISDVQYETMEVIVPKAWSYWAIQEGGIYFPESMDAENGALKGGKLNVPVIWDDEQAVQKPSYRLAVYGEKEQHIKWPSYDEENRPVLSLMLTEEEYIVSEIPGELPDVREYLTNVCYNAAWRDATQYTVKSDGITVAGVTLLSDSEGPMGEGRTPDRNMLSELKSRIEETSYHQTYKSGILLEKTSANGRYDTKAEIIYVAADENVGSEREKSIPATKVNEINIHAPVVCMPIMEADHEDMYQCETVPFGHEVLVLDDEWKHSEFVLQITNAGYHSDKFGYGNRDYSGYLAQRDGKEQNEVCFPFAVWLDSGNDEDITNDMLLEAGEWYVLGTDTQRFYLPVDTQEGSYDIKCRSVAVNGEGYEDKTEIRSNTQPAHYVAESVIKVYVTGRLYNFTVHEVQGTAAWNDVTDGVKYSVGLGSDDADLWETLPLRKGVHPLYRNVGGLPVGGSFGFSVTGIGTSFTESTSLKVVPQLSMVTEEGYKEVDIYFEKEEDNGVFLQLWNSEDETMLLTIADAGESAVQVWEGTFSLPDRLYVAEKGTEVLRYQERFGLSFTEEFWEKDARLMLRFALTIENAQGEILYYGMIPERIVNNIWQTEAEASYREDIDGNRYEIQGGEVAVIDPGDRAGSEDTTHGIY